MGNSLVFSRWPCTRVIKQSISSLLSTDSFLMLLIKRKKKEKEKVLCYVM